MNAPDSRKIYVSLSTPFDLLHTRLGGGHNFISESSLQARALHRLRVDGPAARCAPPDPRELPPPLRLARAESGAGGAVAALRADFLRVPPPPRLQEGGTAPPAPADAEVAEEEAAEGAAPRRRLYHAALALASVRGMVLRLQRPGASPSYRFLFEPGSGGEALRFAVVPLREGAGGRGALRVSLSGSGGSPGAARTAELAAAISGDADARNGGGGSDVGEWLFLSPLRCVCDGLEGGGEWGTTFASVTAAAGGAEPAVLCAATPDLSAFLQRGVVDPLFTRAAPRQQRGGGGLAVFLRQRAFLLLSFFTHLELLHRRVLAGVVAPALGPGAAIAVVSCPPLAGRQAWRSSATVSAGAATVRVECEGLKESALRWSVGDGGEWRQGTLDELAGDLTARLSK